MTSMHSSNFSPYVSQERRIAFIRRLLKNIGLEDVLPSNPTEEELAAMTKKLSEAAISTFGMSEEELGIGRFLKVIPHHLVITGADARDVTRRAMEIHHQLTKEGKFKECIVLDSMPTELLKKGKLPFSDLVRSGTETYPYPNLLSEWSVLANKHLPTVVNIAFPDEEEEAVTELKDEKAKLETLGKETSKLRSILKQSLQVKKAKTRYDNVKKGKRHGRTKP